MAHFDELLATIAANNPGRFLGAMNGDDCREMAEHLKALHDALSAYTIKTLRDFNSDVPVTSTIEIGDYADTFSDMLADTVVGPLKDLADELDELEMEDA